MSNALLNYNESLRTSYLLMLASIATADHENSQEEVAFIQQMCEASQISEQGVQQVINAMKSPQSANLTQHAQAMSNSELRFDLAADVINLAYTDGEMDSEELSQIKSMNSIMNISDEQFQALTQYVQKANQVAEQQEHNPAFQQNQQNNFLGKTGLSDIFSKLNIPTKNFQSGSTIGTVLTGLAASLLQNKLGGTQGGQGGLDLGSIAGAVLGGLSGQQGGSQQGGGLGGILGGLLGSQQGKGALASVLGQVLQTNQQGKGLGSLTDILGGGRKQAAGGGSPLGGLISAFLK